MVNINPGIATNCGNAGFKNIYAKNPTSAWSSSKFVVATLVRQVRFENLYISGFSNAVQLVNCGQIYYDKVFHDACKYSLIATDLADSWFSESHFGSGKPISSATGGTGITIVRGSTITFQACRFQVQDGGVGANLDQCRGLYFLRPIVDQNDSHGMLFINCQEVQIVAIQDFDNGTTAVKRAGIVINTSGDTFTANASTDLITSSTATNFGFLSRVRFTTTGTLPSPLAVDTDYYLNSSGGNSFEVYTNLIDARAGTNQINLVDAGSGTHYMNGVSQNFRIFGGTIKDRVWGRRMKSRIKASTSPRQTLWDIWPTSALFMLTCRRYQPLSAMRQTSILI